MQQRLWAISERVHIETASVLTCADRFACCFTVSDYGHAPAIAAAEARFYLGGTYARTLQS
jgi:hypothetical protein